MKPKKTLRFGRVPLAVAAAAVLLLAGWAAAAKLYGRPKTVLQVVTIKWTSEAAPEQRRAALEEIEKAAAAAPGVRNLWLRALRVQPRDFMSAFAIEFEDAPSAERFPATPAYEQWRKHYLPLIEESYTQQLTN